MLISGTVIDAFMNRVPLDIRQAVHEIVYPSKSTAAQKRTALLKKGLLRSTIDELEILSDTSEFSRSWVIINGSWRCRGGR